MMLGRTVAARLQAPATRLGPASSGGAFPCVQRRALAIWHPAQLRVERRAFLAQGRGVPVAVASGTFAGILDLPIQRRWMSTSGISAEDFPVVELMKQVEVIKVPHPCICVSLHESSITPPQGDYTVTDCQIATQFDYLAPDCLPSARRTSLLQISLDMI